MTEIRLAIVGVGKIVRDQHLPSIDANPAFRLVATASRNASVEGVDSFTDIDRMLAAVPDIDAVSLCMPPQYRYEAAVKALSAGKHVFLEKPPGATISEVQSLVRLAEEKGVTLFASWHSRYAPGVEAARSFLAASPLKRMVITWKEDVRHWHPNQDWIWQAGGLGVFDPGINALSIMTHILPQPVHIVSSVLTFPDNRDAPIAASLTFASGAGFGVEAEFDWRQEGEQSWDIFAETAEGEMLLQHGGARLSINGVAKLLEREAEYPNLYARFAELIAARRIDTDLAPLTHVADAFMLGRRVFTEAFHD